MKINLCDFSCAVVYRDFNDIFKSCFVLYLDRYSACFAELYAIILVIEVLPSIIVGAKYD